MSAEHSNFEWTSFYESFCIFLYFLVSLFHSIFNALGLFSPEKNSWISCKYINLSMKSCVQQSICNLFTGDLFVDSLILSKKLQPLIC